MTDIIFNRISRLFSQLGIDVSSGSAGAGEARAYAAGFDFVNSAFDDVFENIFVQTSGSRGLRMFLNLIDEKYEADDEQNRRKIFNRFLHDGSFLDFNEFKEELIKTAPESEVFFNNGYIMIKNFIKPVTAENLIKAGRFYKKYIPVFSGLLIGGAGISFEYFDNLEMRWFEFDDVNMPVYILDSLE